MLSNVRDEHVVSTDSSIYVTTVKKHVDELKLTADDKPMSRQESDFEKDAIRGVFSEDSARVGAKNNNMTHQEVTDYLTAKIPNADSRKAFWENYRQCLLHSGFNIISSAIDAKYSDIFIASAKSCNNRTHAAVEYNKSDSSVTLTVTQSNILLYKLEDLEAGFELPGSVTVKHRLKQNVQSGKDSWGWVLESVAYSNSVLYDLIHCSHTLELMTCINSSDSQSYAKQLLKKITFNYSKFFSMKHPSVAPAGADTRGIERYYERGL